VQPRRGIKKVNGKGSGNFPIDIANFQQNSENSCTFLTEQIIAAQNFNFTLNFSKIGVFSPECCICGQIFPTRKDFRTLLPQPKI